MTWLVWRQHRKQLLFGVVALLVLGAFFVGTGRPIHDRYERDGLADCLPRTMQEVVVVDLGILPESGVIFPDGEAPPGSETGEPGGEAPPGSETGGPGGIDQRPEDATGSVTLDRETLTIARCALIAREFFGDYQSVIFAGLLLLILPMLAGMFWGAPLIAREVEHGTHRLVWTQGVSRLRWATTKIGLVSAAVLAFTAIYAAMITWWITPVIETSGQRFAYVFFDIHGVVVFGYVLFALALGVLAGAVFGRLLPAMATTVVGFLAARLVVMLVARPRYRPTEEIPLPELPELADGFNQMRNDLHGDWIIDERVVSARSVLTVHPASDFWVFQAVETAIFVGLAVALVAASIYWVRRRIT
jgi:hypothetical protein